MNHVSIIGLIALGGSLGALSRYYISEFCSTAFGNGFPFGTLAVNIIGSFIMGIVVAASQQKILPETVNYAVGVGFLGALTTFSTFNANNFLLMQQGELLKLGLNVAINVTITFAAIVVGYHLLAKN